ncbi:MAG: metallophosphoesterase family protein, partial [Verrucomicrobiota bacterium]
MIYAVISDLHANRQAVNSVLTDIDANGADAVICLGDVVGYGPAPAAVLQTVHARVDHILLGNHDAVVGGRLDPGCFNPGARKIIEWTAGQVDGKARTFLGSLPAVLTGDGFRCAHAEFEMPLRYSYILEEDDAAASWSVCEEQLLFVGHSHRPALFVTGQSGRTYQLDAQDFQAENGKRYIVNVGSVGQPR